MIKSILLSVDGSSYTETVVQTGVELAKKLDAKLQVLSVLDVRPYDWQGIVGSESIVPVVPTSPSSEEEKEKKREQIDAMLIDIDSRLKEQKIEYCFHTPAGLPVDCICEYSRVADLVILGTRGEFQAWHEGMIGATLGPVSRQLEKPFLVVGQQKREFQKFLLAYDGSAPASKAINLAGYLGVSLGMTGTVLFIGKDEDSAAELLQEAREYLKNYELECDCVVESGSPAKRICEFAQANSSDLVIMGAYGHSRLHEVVWGSTTEEVLKTLEIPVLLVN